MLGGREKKVTVWGKRGGVLEKDAGKDAQEETRGCRGVSAQKCSMWSTKVTAVGKLSLGGGGLKCREKCGCRGWQENRSLEKMGEMEDATAQAGTEYTENLSLHVFFPRTQ